MTVERVDEPCGVNVERDVELRLVDWGAAVSIRVLDCALGGVTVVASGSRVRMLRVCDEVTAGDSTERVLSGRTVSARALGRSLRAVGRSVTRPRVEVLRSEVADRWLAVVERVARFGWVSTERLLAERVPERLSTVAVRGRDPRRGFGSQTSRWLSTTTVILTELRG